MTEELLHDLLDCGNTGRTAHEDHLVDLRGVETRVAQRQFAGFDILPLSIHPDDRDGMTANYLLLYP